MASRRHHTLAVLGCQARRAQLSKEPPMPLMNNTPPYSTGGYGGGPYLQQQPYRSNAYGNYGYVTQGYTPGGYGSQGLSQRGQLLGAPRQPNYTQVGRPYGQGGNQTGLMSYGTGNPTAGDYPGGNLPDNGGAHPKREDALPPQGIPVGTGDFAGSWSGWNQMKNGGQGAGSNFW